MRLFRGKLRLLQSGSENSAAFGLSTGMARRINFLISVPVGKGSGWGKGKRWGGDSGTVVKCETTPRQNKLTGVN